MIGCEEFGSAYLENMHAWAKENSVPLTATFELTPFCNFSCVMCYIRLTKGQAEKQGRMLTADEWLEIAKQARDMGTLNLCLTGGEPLAHPDFWKIYGELNKMGFLITVLSNGSLIDETAMENFRCLGMPYSVKLTVYGASNETYLKTCGSSDGFDRLSRAVELLKAAGVPLKLTSTIVRENACDLQGIYGFAREKGLPMRHTVSVVKSARGAVNSAESSRFDFSDFPDELTLEDLEKNKLPDTDTPFAWCASCGTSFWMTWNGHVQLCSFMNSPYVAYSGNLVSDYSALNKKLNAIKNPQECKNCKWKMFCQRCPGVLCAESGHPEKVDRGLCNTAERLYDIYTLKKRGKQHES